MGYNAVFDNQYREEAIQEACLVLKQHAFNTIVVRGVSGMLVGPEVARRLNKILIVVRKGESNHGGHHIACGGYDNTATRYVIVDDFVSSGATIIAIRNNVKMYYRSDAVCVGVFQYSNSYYRCMHLKEVNRDLALKHRAKFVQLDNGTQSRTTE